MAIKLYGLSGWCGDKVILLRKFRGYGDEVILLEEWYQMFIRSSIWGLSHEPDSNIILNTRNMKDCGKF